MEHSHVGEYVEREAAIDACFNGWNNNAHDCAENIRLIPAADVRPVVRGRWVEFETETSPRRNECSECGYITNPWLAHVYNFCPNCGALMEDHKE